MNKSDPQPSREPAHPPETLEGWYAVHQIFSADRPKANAHHEFRRGDATTPVDSAQQGVESTLQGNSGGWTTWARLIGSRSDLMAVHFAPTLDAVGEAKARTR